MTATTAGDLTGRGTGRMTPVALDALQLKELPPGDGTVSSRYNAVGSRTSWSRLRSNALTSPLCTTELSQVCICSLCVHQESDKNILQIYLLAGLVKVKAIVVTERTTALCISARTRSFAPRSTKDLSSA